VALFDGGSEMPEWQRPVAAKYSHVAMSLALSCPECGEPMRFGFRKVCRRCGRKRGAAGRSRREVIYISSTH
jgi:hypothetical protein